MRKMWLIAGQRIWQVIGRWSYWLGVLSPLLGLAVGLAAASFSYWAMAGEKTAAPAIPAPDAVKVNVVPFAEAVGYVDLAQLLQRLPAGVPAGKFRPYATEAEAQTAVAAGIIVGYYVIPADYLRGGQAAYYAPQLTLFSGTDAAFREILKTNLIVGDETHVTRAIRPPRFTYQAADDAPRQVRGTYTVWQLMLGLVLILLFTYALNSIGPYWLGFMVSERERGMLEILLTSASPDQFLIGKLTAAIFLMNFENLLPLISLTLINEGWRRLQSVLAQVSPLWAVVIKEVPPLPLDRLLVMLAVVFLGLLVYSTVYTICGVLIQSPDAVGAVNGGLSTGLMLGSFIALSAVLVDPAGPLALGLSFFPLTAPIFMPARLLLEPVPVWQIGLALGFMALAIWLCLRLAVHLFQLKRWWWSAGH